MTISSSPSGSSASSSLSSPSSPSSDPNPTAFSPSSPPPNPTRRALLAAAGAAPVAASSAAVARPAAGLPALGVSPLAPSPAIAAAYRAYCAAMAAYETAAAGSPAGSGASESFDWELLGPLLRRNEAAWLALLRLPASDAADLPWKLLVMAREFLVPRADADSPIGDLRPMAEDAARLLGMPPPCPPHDLGRTYPWDGTPLHWWPWQDAGAVRR